MPTGAKAEAAAVLSGAQSPADRVTPEPYVPDYQDVDIDSLQQIQPRSVGVEQVALHALSQVGCIRKLTDLGINGAMRAAILGNVIGRMAEPASELSTWNWLQRTVVWAN